MSRLVRFGMFAVMLVLAMTVLAGSAAAHEERDTEYPTYDGEVPDYRTFDEAAEVVVVCKPDSEERIAGIDDDELRAFNEKLLALCEFEHIQAAVDEIRENGPAGGRVNLYVLPGRYLEEPSRNPGCGAGYTGGALDYEAAYNCPNLTNLVGIFGDSPGDPDFECDNPLCFLQLEGTGETDEDVVLRGGFKEDGDWIDNHNGILADRADGIYIRNITAELFRENAMYVLETNGYAFVETVTRYNDLYGLLSFASDNGLMKDCLSHNAGDGAIYPGSPADVYAGEDFTGPLPRPVVEITGCRVHSSALGHSATAGNGIYLHDNDFYNNQTGIVVDSFVPNHPGMPVDHNVMVNNRVWGNNENYYEEFIQTGICDKPPAERGYEQGTVCPAFPLPVGTGVLIGGGNNTFLKDNKIWDNWRAGVMQFWVPAAIREDMDPTKQYDTSHDNQYVDNRLGFAPGGLTQPNGVDFWWDDQGEGNCWQGNKSVTGTVTSNTVLPGGLPDCDSGGSIWTVGNPVKSAGLVPCAAYDREDNQNPPGCDWFITPAAPEGREPSHGEGDGGGGPGGGDNGDGGGGTLAGGDDRGAGSGPTLPATGGGALAALLGAGGLLAAGAMYGRHRR